MHSTTSPSSLLWALLTPTPHRTAVHQQHTPTLLCPFKALKADRYPTRPSPALILLHMQCMRQKGGVDTIVEENVSLSRSLFKGGKETRNVLPCPYLNLSSPKLLAQQIIESSNQPQSSPSLCIISRLPFLANFNPFLHQHPYQCPVCLELLSSSSSSTSLNLVGWWCLVCALCKLSHPPCPSPS